MTDFKELVNAGDGLAQALAGLNGGTPFAKAVTTGNGVAVPGDTGGTALRRQDLAADVKNITFGSRNFTIYNTIPRGVAQATAYEYTIQDGYGESGSSRYIQEMEIADVNDFSVTRKYVAMKIVGDTRQASILSLQVNNTKNPMDMMVNSAMMVVAKSIEYGIFYGDGDLSSKGEHQGNEFDGLIKLIPDENVIDLKGKILTETDLNAAAVKIAENYGEPDSVYMPVGVQAAFVNNQLNRQWVTQGSAVDINAGFTVPTFVSSQGSSLKLFPSAIMMNDKILNVNEQVKPQAPAAPVLTAKVSAGAGKFSDDDVKEKASYAVRIISENGTASAISFVDTDLSSGNASEVSLDINAGVQLIGAPSFVQVFRKDLTTGKFFLIGRVPFFKATVSAGAYHISFVDKNDEIPGTADVFVGQMTQDVIELAELNPMQRIDLAQYKAAVQFAVLWYGGLVLYAPKKFVRLSNVKAQVY